MSLDIQVVERHRRWITGLGISNRSWLILGGAPDANLPDELLRTHARIDINNSGLTAMRLGMARADLTVRREGLSWRTHPRFDTRGLLWISREHPLLLRLRLLRKRQARVDSLMRLHKSERDALVEEVLGEGMATVGELGKPSNGIVAVCYGLRFDIPEIVLAGISLSKDGHSYDSLGRRRKQVVEDLFALQRLRHDSRVATTERDLAEATGLRLWSPTPEQARGTAA